jgi:hypothetical protein
MKLNARKRASFRSHLRALYTSAEGCGVSGSHDVPMGMSVAAEELARRGMKPGDVQPQD